jgi:hypothetical protein
MKTKVSLLISLSILLFQCSTEEKIAKSTLWGVDFSDESTTAFAQGTIELQKQESTLVYVLKEGSIRQAEENLYTVSLVFDNGESLQLTVTKETADCNFNFPADASSNRLVAASLNGNALNLAESSIVIQPQQGDNKLNITIANMQTVEAENFNGTLTRVPLLQ